MIVDLFRSRVRPFGTGISSNSLLWGRGGEDAHAVRIRTTADTTSHCRMLGHLLHAILRWAPARSQVFGTIPTMCGRDDESVDLATSASSQGGPFLDGPMPLEHNRSPWHYGLPQVPRTSERRSSRPGSSPLRRLRQPSRAPST